MAYDDDGQRHPPIFESCFASSESQQISSDITCKEIIPDEGWLLSNCLARDECQRIVKACETSGFEDARAFCHMYVNRFNDRMMTDDEDLADFLWKRVGAYAPRRVDVDGKTWTVKGLNSRFRVCRYFKDHYFGRHRDGEVHLSPTLRSLYTCMFYLNDMGEDFEGGATKFLVYGDRGDVRTRFDVVPKAGRCVVFRQTSPNTLHEGIRLASGTKYILRTDVMYTID
ncbi:uncharacterized protein [Oscarella lobularis]|uniref:uncharacterized protein n=1 Tax=Oscarella lobularis TaxID=121494 RepID=UPI00331338DB